MISGAQKPVGGAVQIEGKPITSPVVAAQRGAGYVAESRSQMILPGLDLMANTTIACLGKMTRARLVSRKKESTQVQELAQRIKIKGNLQADITTLSGGNQQKAMLGRWLLKDSSVFVLDEPRAPLDADQIVAASFAREGIATDMSHVGPEETRPAVEP